MDSGIMGFCGFGWMFSDSTTLRIRLCVFSDRDEPFTCQPVRHFACTVASNSDRDWESSWSWARDSLTETAETSPLSGVAMSVVPLPLELLRLLRLLWYLYRSLVKLLGIITRQARGKGGHTKKKKMLFKNKEKPLSDLVTVVRYAARNNWITQMNVKLVSCFSFQTSIRNTIYIWSVGVS